MIVFKNISKGYDTPIFENISFSINSGECVAFTGESGCGKSTILNIIGLLENYDSGEYLLMNKNVKSFKDKNKTAIMKNEIGYIFQNFALIDDETVLNNLKLSIPDRKKRKNCNEAIDKVLNEVGMLAFKQKKIYTLSGGEQQRIAIARILLKDCNIILADEPTGSLDSKTRDEILELLMKLRNDHKTIIIVTHDQYVANWCNRKYILKRWMIWKKF
ncbi:ABC transporter ATP-binding protein [Mycoplasma sp. P36-A1]|uniref:ABC transporter ATP-binding protein n=1 Tax=Mycoplasma sp. P36-A1 TaxID=3252900 RepID=UPI003C2EF567